MTPDGEHVVRDVAALRALYGGPAEVSVVKETRCVGPDYRAWIAASPFAVLATSGPDGLDASPRGDAPGFVHVEDERTLLMPDRRGNNRIDGAARLRGDLRGERHHHPGAHDTSVGLLSPALGVSGSVFLLFAAAVFAHRELHHLQKIEGGALDGVGRARAPLQ